MNVLELKGVTKSYGDFVLDKVSFEVPEGGICGFIGQNGARYILKRIYTT